MLSADQNEFLTRVGPGTPMGSLLRCYWQPLLYSHELAEPDGAPLRIKLLGENLLAFRDTSGGVGLVDELCPHRRASLFYGRNEEGGLRCAYHGWKFAVDGTCLEIPNEPGDCPLLGKVRATAYPCREANGIIWAYLGEGTPPALPQLGWATVPAENKTVLNYIRFCNWMQAMEGDFDSSHLGFLHRDFARDPKGERFAPTDGGDALRPIVALDKQPRLEVEDTPIGVMYGACRDTPEDGDYWRVTQFQLPFYTSVPAYGGLNRLKIWVPMDDHHTRVFEANWTAEGKLAADVREGLGGRVGPSGFLPDDDGWFGRGRFAARAENDYLIDRERQKHMNFSGMEDGTPVQDAAMQESMGAIVDRSQEHLSASDAAIIRMRKALMQAAQRLAEDGVSPPGVADPDQYRAHGDQFLIGAGEEWQARYTAAMEENYRDLPLPEGR
jgi:nitrite reductase/ring-hydroxylating ferredoxin subunit